MSRYDVSLDISQENEPRTKILKRVAPGSLVLEFGCAGGVMTEYLKDTLGCRVFIVEIDEESYNSAVRFAEGGFCGDAESLGWLDTFAGMKFDYIMFADVLEHLYRPERVLEKSAGLLKEGGQVLLSVPNIAHDSIILGLLKNNFKYRDRGLLDSTHIRFFTYYSLLDMLDQTGLSAVAEDAAYIDAAHSELEEEYDMFTGNLEALKDRDFGKIYQFVFAAVKKDFYLENKDNVDIQRLAPERDLPLFARASIYFDSGSGFSENEAEYPLLPLGGDFYYEINLQKTLLRLRFDPAEGLLCAVKGLEILSNAGRLDYKVFNGLTLGNYHFFPVTDPQIMVELTPEVTWISIECKIHPYDAAFLNGAFVFFNECLAEAELKKRMLEQEIKAAELDKENLREAFSKKVSELKTEIISETKALQEQTSVMETLLKEAERHHIAVEQEAKREIERKNAEITVLEADVDKKTVDITVLKADIDEKAAIIAEYSSKLTNADESLAEAESKFAELTARYNAITNAFFWKITKPMRAVLGLMGRK